MTRRCDMCAACWPTSVNGACPECDGNLSYMHGETPMPPDEAQSRIAHAGFKKFLEAETPEQREARQKKFQEELAAEFAGQLEQL